MNIAWKGLDFDHGNELLEVMELLASEDAVGSQRLSALAPHATLREARDALAEAHDDLIRARGQRADPDADHPDLDRLALVYMGLQHAVSHAEEAIKALGNMDYEAMRVRSVLRGERS